MRCFARRSWLIGVVIAPFVSVASARAETDVERLIARAMLGSVEAQTELGMSYRQYGLHMPDGSKIEKDMDQAERWLKEASKKNLQARLWLGGLYSSDDFPRRDDALAARIFAEIARTPGADKQVVESAAEGLADILYQECTGYLISLDCGKNDSSPRQDYKAAAYWFKIAAEGGHRQAQFQLATMYENGRGVPQDFVEAAKLYELADAAGHDEAAVMLAELYKKTQKRAMAYMWFNLAATAERPQAAERRGQLSKSMSQEEIEEGQRLTREYLATRKKDCGRSKC